MITVPVRPLRCSVGLLFDWDVLYLRCCRGAAPDDDLQHAVLDARTCLALVCTLGHGHDSAVDAFADVVGMALRSRGGATLAVVLPALFGIA
jgi:hypothetical protein